MKKLLSIIFAILMVVTAMPYALAAGDDLAISGVNMSSSTPYLASGSKEASATQPETGGYAYWDAASNTLTLNNFTSATDALTGIFYDGSADTLRIELVGNNSVTGGTATAARSGVCLYNTNTNILFSGGGTITATGIASGYGVDATGGNITVDSGTTLIATGGISRNGVYADSITVNAGGSLTGNGGESSSGVSASSITVNAGGSLTGNGGESSSGVSASSITVNGGSLTGNGGESGGRGVSASSLTVNGDSHIVANGGSSGNKIPVENLPEDYYYYASGDGTDKTFAHSTDAPLTGTVTETYFELVTAQHLSDTYTSNGDATHSRYCSCALHTKVTAPEACSGGTATCAEQAKCERCGASYGELDADGHDWSNKDGVCANGCGEVCPHEKYTDGVCDNCEYECSHEWGEGVLTRPTFESEGYYTYTCTLCGEEKTEPTEKADDTALNDASMKVMEYIGNSTLTQEALNEIDKSYRDILKNNGNIFDEFGSVRNDLIEEDQPAINAVTAELEKIIADADEKIASGEYVKADYTEIDEAIAKIEQKLTDENITDEGKAGLEEIKKQLEEMKSDENTSKADLAELEKALEDYEEEVDKGIEDGTLVEVDVDAIADDVNKKWAEKLEAEGLLDEYEDFINNQKATDEAMATVDEINVLLYSLEGTVAENAENIAKLNEMLDSLFESWENCLRGTHNFKDYEITSPAKCEVNAIETGTCWFCGETDEREVEGSALEHSFTKYEEVTAPECGKAGLEKAVCDHGCGAIDENEIPALEHIDADGDYKCDNGCGYEFEKPAEPENPCEDCGKVHKNGLQGFLCFVFKLVKMLFESFKA